MKKNATVLIIVSLFLLSTAVVFAAPVNLPESIKGKAGVWLSDREVPWMVGESVPVGGSVGFVFDSFERKIKDSTKIQGSFWGAKGTVTLMDKVDIYAVLGAMTDGEYSNSVGDKISFDSGFMWSIGGNLIIYDWQTQGVKFFTDINYRHAGMDCHSMTIAGTDYTKENLNQDMAGEYREWQVALGLSKQLNEYLIPYGGVIFCDAHAKALASIPNGSGSVSGGVKGKDLFGPFLGLAYLPAKGVSIDVQGRLVEEKAVTLSSEVKF